MKGFISGPGKGLLSLAAVVAAALGCNLLEQNCNAGGFHPFGCKTGSCATDGCADGKCGGADRDFDYEQLHSDHCWPSQFTRESKRRVYAPFYQQMVNGLAIETTIWNHYFNPEKGKEHLLSEAGEAHLRYLARKKPFVIPTLQLQTTFDSTLDEKRVASTLDYLKKVSTEPVAWNVVMANRAVPGMYGPEAPKSINKMIGPAGGPPAYELNIKREFLSGGGAGSGVGTGS